MVRISNYDGRLASQIADFRERGQKEASLHRPASEATHPDSSEVELKSDAEGLVSNEQSLFDSVISEADRKALEADSKLIELRSDIQQALADDTIISQIDAELAGERKRLVDATAHRIKAEVDWRSFRARNNIEEMPSYPESQIWHWSIIIVLIFVETIVNAFFYQNANGLIGGFVVAAAVALVNMGSAVALGSNFRRKNLAASEQRYFGWACLAVFVPLTLFCNALFASFRATYQTILDPSDALQLREGFTAAWSEAVRIFIIDYKFADFSSFLLFGFGLILSIFAFWKGYTSDDPYPGHSKRDIVLKNAQAFEAKTQDSIKQQVTVCLVSHRNKVQGLSSQTGAMISMLSSSLTQVEHASRTLHANALAIQRDYHLVLDSYRQSNLAVRGTQPPKYFKHAPEIAGAANSNLGESAVQRIKSSLAALETLQGKHRDALNEKLIDLQEKSSEILTATYKAFLVNVEEDARAEVQRNIHIMPELT